MADKVFKCEVKVPFREGGTTVRRWTVKPVTQVNDGAEVRCLECHGEVRIHRKKKADGVPDHVEHCKRADSESCSLGHYFKGVSEPSQWPVD